MKRSTSSSLCTNANCVSANNVVNDLDVSRHNGEHLAAGDSLAQSSPRRSIFPNASSRAAISAGRALLDRPAASSTRKTASAKSNNHNTPFTASAATTPLPRLHTEPARLKSCLSSSNVLSSPSMSMKGSTTSLSAQQNEAFPLPPQRPTPIKRNVSFSHLQVREYDITLGDNPSVSSGLPISLDWSYNPKERVASIEAFEAVRIRRNSSDLVLSDRQRDGLLNDRTDITFTDVNMVLQDVAAARLERKMSRNELIEERQRERNAISMGRREMRSRRMSELRSN